MQNLLFLICLCVSLGFHAALGWMRVEPPVRTELALDELKSGETTISVQVVPAVAPREVVPVEEEIEPIELEPVETELPEPDLKPMVRARTLPERVRVHQTEAVAESLRSVPRDVPRTQQPLERPVDRVPVPAQTVQKKLTKKTLETEVVVKEIPRPTATAAELGVRTPAQLKTRAPILYPEKLQQEGVEGRVVLQAQVLSDGRLAEVRVKTSSGQRELDQAALESVRKWVFRPALQGDKAISQQVLIPVEFRVRLAE
ncbi:MAG: TonB family protein [Planctomycetota bacterium]|nr:TonB family protein [Planctomycetota bacterium]